MRHDEQMHQDWLKTVREIDQMIDQQKKGIASPVKITLKQLHTMRDEAFRKVEETTVDHIIAIHKLKTELNLTTRYR